MLLNGGGGSRSALRPRSANDENAVVGGASKGPAGLGKSSAKTPGGNAGNTNKPTVRLALGPAKSLDVNGGGIVAKTPGPSNARRRAFGDISNRKAGRGPGNQNAAGGAKTPKAVSFQSNLFGPPAAKTPGGAGGGLVGNGGGGGGKSAKKKGLQLQQQRTTFASRNPNANASTNPNRSVSFEPSSSSTAKLPSNAVMPMSSRKEKASKALSVVVPRTTSVVQDQIIDVDDGGGSVSSVELPAGGRIWDPSDFFGDDDSYDLAAKIAAVNTSLDDDPSFVMPTFPSKAAAAVGTDADDDRLFAKEMEELEKEDYETLDHLLNDFAPEDDDDDLLSGLTPSLEDHDGDDHDDGLGLLDDLDDLALA